MYAVVLLMFCICSWVALLCPSVQAYEAPRLKQDDPAQESMTVNEGSKLRLKCRVLGSPQPYIVWYKNGKKLTRREDKRLKVNKNSLLITQPREKDSGQYSCYRENQYGHVWKNYSLTIMNEKESEEPKFVDCKTDGPPQFKDRSKLYEWIARPAQVDFVDFECDVCGSPEPNVTWYFKDRRITLGVSGPAKYKVKRKTSLVVDKLTVSDAGEYTCVGQNEHGSVNHTFELKVIDRVLTKPVIQGPVNQTVTYMDDARFDCTVVMSDLQHHIQWFKHYEVNGSYMNEDDEPNVYIIQQSSFNLTKPETLFIRNVTYEDAGWYTCLVTNAMGRAFQSAYLTVVKKCGNKTYGMECKEQCGNCSNGEPCHHVDGSCRYGCDAGVYGKTCDEACQPGRYGINCGKPCGPNCQGCNRFTGVCEFGCLPGWTGPSCEKRSNYMFR
ncbi:fibroblast growth factor receptor 1-A-like isoform X2 [Crassostrea virginica]